ncbi:hypothetical protein TrST_g6445 [Triparma strigata]|uniref:Uncharacterized protein n=1 Tax=Triparma strigata TaxID=1606541 RepID=A0A9W7DTA3_9STRA|nr:hypothetical protein TrST_g6445 [Triparma strigata]
MPFGMVKNDGDGDVGMEDPENEVITAAGDGDLARVQAILPSKGFNHSDSNGYTCLHAAAAYKRMEVINWLLVSGADVNVKDNDGDTPLHHCESLEVAQLLVAKGADKTLCNSEGKTAMDLRGEDIVPENDEDYDLDDEEQKDIKEMLSFLLGIEGTISLTATMEE